MDTTSTEATVRRNLDAEFCGKVPLHQTNMIQPHGVLLVVDAQTLQILQVSENIEEYINIAPAEIVNTSLQQHLQEGQLAALQERLQQPATHKAPVVISINKKDFLALLLHQDGYVIIELELLNNDAAQNSFIDIYAAVKSAIAAIDEAQSTMEVCKVAAKELKRISGFDKVMIYRFDEEWNGTVLAEEMEGEMESYIGLIFPASDIPKQAREMYRKSAYRLIPNRDYTPVKLYPVLNPTTFAFTDLTNCHLRSVVAVHVEYLKNMKVVASMSTRILKDGNLWGLIACHHRTPNYLSYQNCSVFEWLSGAITARIGAIQNREETEIKTTGHQLLNKITEGLYKSDSAGTALHNQQEDLLQLLQADGLAICLDNSVKLVGVAPNERDVEQLIYWMQTTGIIKLHYQQQLPPIFQGVFAPDVAGFVALPVMPSKNEYLFAFRKEAIQKINWGGNPNEAVQFDSEGKGYHPRDSFKIWQETVKNISLPWQPTVVTLAEALRNLIIEYRLYKNGTA